MILSASSYPIRLGTKLETTTNETIKIAQAISNSL